MAQPFPDYLDSAAPRFVKCLLSMVVLLELLAWAYFGKATPTVARLFVLGNSSIGDMEVIDTVVLHSGGTLLLCRLVASWICLQCRYGKRLAAAPSIALRNASDDGRIADVVVTIVEK